MPYRLATPHREAAGASDAALLAADPAGPQAGFDTPLRPQDHPPAANSGRSAR